MEHPKTLTLPQRKIGSGILNRFKNPGFQKYFKNASWMFFSRIVSMVFSFFVTAYVVRYLGPTNYGQLSYSIGFIGIFSVVSALGLDQILFRELIKHPENKDAYLGTSLVLKTLAGVIAIFTVIITSKVISGGDISFLLICIISLTYLFNGWNIISIEFQSHVNTKWPAIASILVNIILSILKILVVLLNKGIIYMAFIFVLEPIILAIFYVIYRKKYYGSIFKWKFSMPIAKYLLSHSWPLIFSSAFIMLYTRIDQVMIKNMIDARSVGIYDAAARISEAWYFIPALIVSSLFPAIINAKKTSIASYRSRLRNLGILLMLISVVVAGPIAYFAKPIIHLFYGSDFSESASILQVYIWAGIGTSLAYLTQHYLLAEHNQRAIFVSTFVAMFINILLNIYLIPRYGMIGAAWATCISYFCNTITLFFYTNIRKDLIKIILNKKETTRIDA